MVQISLIIRKNLIVPIWNIYNAPVGSDEAGGGLNMLLRCTQNPFFVGGDFNLRHPLWDPIVDHARTNCDSLIE